MGPVADPLSGVDRTGEVHGVNGLFVADAFVFPDVPRGTTALPTFAVGERVSLFWKGESVSLSW
jgi:choline dehydrogenase